MCSLHTRILLYIQCMLTLGSRLVQWCKEADCTQCSSYQGAHPAFKHILLYTSRLQHDISWFCGTDWWPWV